jgi:hypothetical protein
MPGGRQYLQEVDRYEIQRDSSKVLKKRPSQR